MLGYNWDCCALGFRSVAAGLIQLSYFSTCLTTIYNLTTTCCTNPLLGLILIDQITIQIELQQQQQIKKKTEQEKEGVGVGVGNVVRYQSNTSTWKLVPLRQLRNLCGRF